MSLTLYRRKRNFKATAEPAGKVKASHSKNLYLIQKHAASRLHYDFRIELNGTLKSWAVPKGPSLDPSVKRLAVQVEDHPIEYGSFEGTIPKGQYGGGTVMLWDTGTWHATDNNPQKAFTKGDLKLTLNGIKLKGDWKLIRLHNDPKNWLLIKAKDKYAKPEPYDITEKKSRSVISKKSLDQIAASNGKVHKSHQKKISVPHKILPQLATLTDQPPVGKNWLHEIKFDGYRLICYVEQGKIRLLTRGQKDWTHKFPTIAAAFKKLKLPDCIIDGEVVALNEDGHSDFQLLQNQLKNHDPNAIAYYAFDLMHHGHHDLTNESLMKRKRQLRKIIPNKKTSLIQFSDHVIGNGSQVFKKSCQLQLEGIVSKNIESPYTQKRSRDWLKVKCINRQEFVIGGYTQPNGSRSHFGSLLIGYYDKNSDFIYAGHVGTGFTNATLKELSQSLTKIKTTKMPFQQKPPLTTGVIWVKPTLIAEVEFTQWTRDNILRHPSFKGLRSDKKPQTISQEKPIKHLSPANTSTLSHPDKILYPEDKLTKADLAKYYQAIHQWMLPYISKRPLTLVRCPQGYAKTCFYQKHIEKNSVASLHSITIKDKTKTELYPYLDTVAGLIALVQLSVLEIHTWGSHCQNAEKADVIIFDLDPAPDVGPKQIIKAAKHLRERLKCINLISFVKTTGGKGLHIVVPIKPIYTWQQIKEFTRAFADAIVAETPQDYIATMSKAKRKGKIFIDYLRNQHGATAIAPYSTRARRSATVSVPLSWEELTSKKISAFTIKNVPKRLTQLKVDPWKDFYHLKQTLPLKKFK